MRLLKTLIISSILVVNFGCKTSKPNNKTTKTIDKNAVLDYALKGDSLIVFVHKTQLAFAKRVENHEHKLPIENLKRVKTDELIDKMDVEFPIGRKPYLSPNRNLASYKSFYNFKAKEKTDVTTDPKVPFLNFKRVFKSEENPFMNLGLDFKIIPHYLKSGRIAFTIDSLKYNFSRVKISKQKPIVFVSLSMKLNLKDGTTFSTSRLLIPLIPGRDDFNNQINYKPYYAKAIPVAGVRAIETKVEEIHIEGITNSEYMRIINTHSELPDILEAIHNSIKP